MAPLKLYDVNDPQVQIRIPKAVKAWLAELATTNGSSMAFEASRRLKAAMAEESKSRKSRTSAAS